MVISSAYGQESVVAQRVQQLQDDQVSFTQIPEETMFGYPVPVVLEAELFLGTPVFLDRGLPPNPPEYTAPGWIAYIDISSGERVILESLDTDLNETLGKDEINPNFTYDELLAAEERLYAAMSALLPVAQRPEAGVPPDLEAAAAEFRALWNQLAHKPLASHYRALNPAWFDALFGR
jgi:hypothetical protein